MHAHGDLNTPRVFFFRPASALSGAFKAMPDVHYDEDTHVVAGDTGISRWTVTGTTPVGQKIRANGCDFYTFRGGLVVKKDSCWTIVEA